MASTSRAMKDLSDQSSPGTRLGASTTDLIGFYGITTGVAQTAIGGSLSSTALVSSVIQQLITLNLVNVTTFGA